LSAAAAGNAQACAGDEIPEELRRPQSVRFDTGNCARALDRGTSRALRVDLAWIRHARLAELATRWIARTNRNDCSFAATTLMPRRSGLKTPGRASITEAQRTFITAMEDAGARALSKRRATKK
jgi:hypothetical protein